MKQEDRRSSRNEWNDPHSLLEEKGVGWELSNSLWIGWSVFFFGFFTWISFFYAGKRAKRPDWIGWGMIYMIPFLLSMSGVFIGLGAVLMLPTWFAGMVHAFSIRREYLYRLAAVELSENEAELRWLEEMQNEMSEGKTAKKTPGRKAGQLFDVPPPPPPPPSQVESKTASSGFSEVGSFFRSEPLIDVNNASADVIAALPGFDPTLAQKTVLMRQMSGEFRSPEDFFRALDLTEEQIEKIRHRVTLKAMEASPMRKSDTLVEL